MKYLSVFCLAVAGCWSLPVISQTFATGVVPAGGDHSRPADPAQPCITDWQYQSLRKRMATPVREPENNVERRKTPVFSWPLRYVGESELCDYYAITNYVDQNFQAGQVLDYNCGTFTYDGHHGIDIMPSPFPFFSMDHDEVEVVAAAPGKIIDKDDGHYDRNCQAGSAPANYVVIEHSDGSIALYFHMKKNTVTAKGIGQQVTAGERLGLVGSSGSSTGPHLHFEVWADHTYSQLIDPYAGTCSQAKSYWAQQKPYVDPSVLAVSVNTAPAVFPPCPNTETLNAGWCFARGAVARFHIFLRDETAGQNGTLSIKDANGVTINSWPHQSVNNYTWSYWYYNVNVPGVPGDYVFEATYGGKTCSRIFRVDCNHVPAGIAAHRPPGLQLIACPVPSSGEVLITANTLLTDGRLEVYDATGTTVRRLTGLRGTSVTLQRNGLPPGIYYARVDSGTSTSTLKLVIAD